MQVCNYCGRNLKQHYEICPGCGSNSFTEKRDLGDSYVIETPPTGGYKLDTESLKGQAKLAKFFKYFGIAFLVFEAFSMIPFVAVPFFTSGIDTMFSVTWIGFLLAFIPCFSIVPIIFILISSNMIKKNKQDVARLEELAKTGILIKNIPYQTVPSNYAVNGQQIMAIQLKYETPDGKILNLRSNPKFDNKVFDTDGKADLLIDPKDHTNYYIDIEIY